MEEMYKGYTITKAPGDMFKAVIKFQLTVSEIVDEFTAPTMYHIKAGIDYNTRKSNIPYKTTIKTF